MLLTSTKNTTETAKEDFELNRKKAIIYGHNSTESPEAGISKYLPAYSKNRRNQKYNNKIIVKYNNYEPVEINVLSFTIINRQNPECTPSFSKPKCVVLLVKPFKVDERKKCGDDINVICLHQVTTCCNWLALAISGKF